MLWKIVAVPEPVDGHLFKMRVEENACSAGHVEAAINPKARALTETPGAKGGDHAYLAAADVKGFFDHLDHDQLLSMSSLLIDDRAFLGLIRKWLQAACRRVKEWIKLNRHRPVRVFFHGLNLRLRGHYNYYGVRGNSDALYRFFDWARERAFKWLNRRGGKRWSYTWARFTQVLLRVQIARPRITQTSRRRVMA